MLRNLARNHPEVLTLLERDLVLVMATHPEHGKYVGQILGYLSDSMQQENEDE